LIHTRSRLNGWAEFGRRYGLVLAGSEEGLQVDRTPLALEAARAGLGIALESSVLAAAYLREGSLVTPFEQSIDDEAYYFVHAPHASRAKVEIFRAWLQHQIGGAEERTDGDGALVVSLRRPA